MSRRASREFKIGLPITLRNSGSGLVLGDGFFSHTILSEELDQIKLKSIDKDGFILFEIRYLEHGKFKAAPQKIAKINGFKLFHTSIPKSTAYGSEKSIYEYYKRDEDVSYLVLVKRGPKKYKIQLGSLLKPESKIHQFATIINKAFSFKEKFDRGTLNSLIPSNLRHGQKLKGLLDILTVEEFLNKTEKKKGGQINEVFVKTEKLYNFLEDPSSALKPSGVKPSRFVPTSDR